MWYDRTGKTMRSDTEVDQTRDQETQRPNVQFSKLHYIQSSADGNNLYSTLSNFLSVFHYISAVTRITDI